MPPEWYAIDGSRLVKDLRARREGLPQVAEEFYLHLAKKVDVYLTNRSERVDAVRTPQGDMEVTVRVLGPGNQPGDVTYHRVFLGRETEEVRLYALGGDDVVAVSGGKRGPLVRMVGGKGDDTLDATGAGNAKLSDSEGRNRTVEAAHDDKPYAAPPPPKNAPWIPPRDFTRETWGQPLVAYNADTGVFLGYGIQHYRYGFRKSPYASSHHVTAGWAFDQESGRVDYLGNFHRENRRTPTSACTATPRASTCCASTASATRPRLPQNTDYYKVHATQYVAYPALRVPFASRWQLSVGPVLKYTSNEQDRNELINTVNPYGAGDYGALAVHGILSWDSRDSIVLPQSGAFAAVRGTWFPKAWDVDSSFGQVNGNVNAYLPLGGRTTLALRGGGKKVFGTYPYMEAAALGQGTLGAGRARRAGEHAARLPLAALHGRRLGVRQRRPSAAHLGHEHPRARGLGPHCVRRRRARLARRRIERQVAHQRGRRAVVLLADEASLGVRGREPQRGGDALLPDERPPLLMRENSPGHRLRSGAGRMVGRSVLA